MKDMESFSCNVHPWAGGWSFCKAAYLQAFFPSPYLRTASIQRLDVGSAWEQDYISLVKPLVYIVSQPITGCIARQEVKVLSY